MSKMASTEISKRFQDLIGSSPQQNSFPIEFVSNNRGILANDIDTWFSLINSHNRLNSKIFKEIVDALLDESSAFDSLIQISDNPKVSDKKILGRIIVEALAKEVERVNSLRWENLKFHWKKVFGSSQISPMEEVLDGKVKQILGTSLFKEVADAIDLRFKNDSRIRTIFYCKALDNFDDHSAHTGMVLSNVVGLALSYSSNTNSSDTDRPAHTKSNKVEPDVTRIIRETLTKFYWRMLTNRSHGSSPLDTTLLDRFHIRALTLYGLSICRKLHSYEADYALRLHTYAKGTWETGLLLPKFDLPHSVKTLFDTHQNELLPQVLLQDIVVEKSVSNDKLQKIWKLITEKKIHFSSEAALICKVSALVLNGMTEDDYKSTSFNLLKILDQLKEVKGGNLTVSEVTNLLEMVHPRYLAPLIFWINNSSTTIDAKDEEGSSQTHRHNLTTECFALWSKLEWSGLEELHICLKGDICFYARVTGRDDSTSNYGFYEEIGDKLINESLITCKLVAKYSAELAAAAEILAAKLNFTKMQETRPLKKDQFSIDTTWPGMMAEYKRIFLEGRSFIDDRIQQSRGLSKLREIACLNLLKTAPIDQNYSNILNIVGNENYSDDKRVAVVLRWIYLGCLYIEDFSVELLSKILSIPLGVSKIPDSSVYDAWGTQCINLFVATINRKTGQNRSKVRNLLAQTINGASNTHLSAIKLREENINNDASFTSRVAAIKERINH